MFTKDPTSDGPESIGDLKASKQSVRDQIEFDLSQPIDPAILEKITREREELDRLSQKAVTEISGDEALRLIWGKQLNYADVPHLFKLWWKSIYPATQKEINIAAEDFEDHNDYLWKCLTASGGSVLNATKETLGIKSLYAQFQANMPTITAEQFTSLWIDAVQQRKVVRRGQPRSAVKSFIDDYMDQMRQVLYCTFSIVGNRPTSEQQRDRQFSKSSYQGLTPREIARQWNYKHRKSKRVVTSTAVSKAIERYRKKREPVMWLLRVWIHKGNFPKLSTRICPRCQGKGKIYPGMEWAAWHWRRLVRPDWRAVLKDDPEPPCPPPQHCEECDGSGIRNPHHKT